VDVTTSTTTADPLVQEQPPQQLRYALLLEWGTRAGLAVLAASFFAYVTGLLPAHVPLERLPQLWSLPVDQYLGLTRSPTGWGWLSLLHRSDALGLAGIAILAACSVAALLALVPLYARRRDTAFVVLCLIESFIVLLAASGVLGGAL
jgi:hypothetical protein